MNNPMKPSKPIIADMYFCMIVIAILSTLVLIQHMNAIELEEHINNLTQSLKSSSSALAKSTETLSEVLEKLKTTK